MQNAMNPNTPPVVSGFKVGRIKFVSDNFGVSHPEWATQPYIVNPLDMEAVLKDPNIYILAWQEIHFKPVYQRVGASMVPSEGEQTIEHQHTINQAIVQTMQMDAERSPGNINFRQYRSFETILLEAGWKFAWEAVGEDDRLGAVVRDELLVQASDHPIVKRALTGQQTTAEPESAMPFEFISPPFTEAEPQPQGLSLEERQDKLEFMLGQILEMLGASQNSVGLHQPSVAGNGTGAVYDAATHQDQPRGDAFSS